MASTKQGDAGAAAPMARIVPKPKPVLLPTEAVKGTTYLCAQSPTAPMTTPTHMVLSTPVNAPSTQWRTEICPGAPVRHAKFSLSSSGESTPGSQGYRSPVSPLAHPHLARPLFRRTTAPIIPLARAAEASEPQPQPRSPAAPVVCPAQATSPMASAKPVLFSRPVYHAHPVAVKGSVPNMQKTPPPAPVEAYDPPAGAIINTPSPDKRGSPRHQEQTPEAVDQSDRVSRRLLTM